MTINDPNDQAILQLARDIEIRIPSSNGFVNVLTNRDDTWLVGSKTGLMTLSVALLLASLNEHEAKASVEQRIARMVPGGALCWLGARLSTPQEEREATKNRLRDFKGTLVVMLTISSAIAALSLIGVWTLIQWIW